MINHKSILKYGLPVLILLVGCWLLLVFQFPKDSMVMSELQNSGHTVALFALALVLAYYLQNFYYRGSPQRALLISIVLCLVFSVAIEIIQDKIGREASLSDLLMDCLGIVSGALFYIAMKMTKSRKYLLFFIAFLILAGSLIKPVSWAIAEKKRDAFFPIIGDFEVPAMNKYFSAKYSAEYFVVAAPVSWKENTSQVAKVEFHPGSWPGLQAFEMQDDWRNYSQLHFDVFNPHEKAISLVLRIHDSKHNHTYNDRFNRTYNLKTGLHHMRVDIEDILHTRSGRVLSPRRIKNLMLYMDRPQEQHTLYFDNFRLE